MDETKTGFTELRKFVPQCAEILPPGIVTVEGTVDGRPAVWVGSAAQMGCLVFPPPEKKESPAKM